MTPIRTLSALTAPRRSAPETQHYLRTTALGSTTEPFDPGRGLRFASEALHLERDDAVGGPVDLAHPAPADQLLQPIVPEWCRIHRTVNAMPGQSTYTAAKAGLVGLSRALALEVVGDGVTVNVVAPGYIATDSQLPFEAAAAASGHRAQWHAGGDRRVRALSRPRVGLVRHRDGSGGRRRPWSAGDLATALVPGMLYRRASAMSRLRERRCGQSADGGNVQVGLGVMRWTRAPARRADWVHDEGITARPIPLSTTAGWRCGGRPRRPQ